MSCDFQNLSFQISHFYDVNKLLCQLSGVHLSKDQQVLQTPSDIIVKPNQTVQLSLSHSIPSYDTVLWYQRSPGDSALKLIGYAMARLSPKIEPSFQSNFKMNGDGYKSVNLSILDTRHPEDSGEYFGAASYHGGEDSRSVRHKTSVKIQQSETGNHGNRVTPCHVSDQAQETVR